MGQWPRLCLPVVAVLMLGGVCRAQGAVRTPLSTPELGALPPWVSRVTAAQGEPPGTTIVVNSLGRWPFGVKADGVIHLEEAFSYAAQDPAANQILFASALDGPNGIVFDDRWFGGETLSGDGDSIVGDFGSWDPRVKLAEELYVTGSSCTVRGLCLRWCEVSGDDNRVRACHFGLDLDGETSWAPGYVYGLNVTGNRNTIGGDRVWYRNHFGRAAGGPVGVNGSENVFCTNVVGLKPDLWTPLDDPPTSGVWVGGHHNQIGGIENRFNCIYATDTCMDIGGNTGDDGHHNAIRMNYLGQNNAKAKCKYGLVIEDGARGNIIGGPVSPEYGPNVIVNFTEAGIKIEPRCHGTTIVGSCIGMDQWGNGVAPDEPAWGVVVGRNVSGTKIGSSAPTQRNRFGRPGIRIREGATNTVIRGNWMGLDDANRPVGAEYYHHGIEAIGAERLTIGGQHRSGADEGNLLVGHAVAIHLTDCTGPVVIEGNTIGALPDRSAPAGGRGFGITLEGCASVRIGPRIAETTASGGEAPTGVPSSLYGNLIMPGRGSIGISLGSCSSVQIEGNLIGWEDPAAAPGGDQGIRVGLACRAIRIGGSLGNRICRNDQNVGVYGADDVTLTNNKIRSATAGDGVLIGFGAYNIELLGNRIEGNARDGLRIDGTDGVARNIAVGALADGPSLLGGNGGYGVRVLGADAHHVTVAGSWIGVAPSAASDRWIPSPNALGGVLIDRQAHDNTVGLEEAPNAICANAGPGVVLAGGAQRNTVAGNWIGRSRPENQAPGNAKAGVLIAGRAHDNRIGVAAETSVAGNRGPGIVIRDAGSTGNEVGRCVIGAGEVAGVSVPDGNAGAGVDLWGGATDNRIGDTGAGNTIACNQGAGVRIRGSGTNRNKVVLNWIGMPPKGLVSPDLSAWRNGGDGVEISAGARNNVIGGPDDGSRNWIANNGGSGVRMAGQGTNTNYVASNAIGLNHAGKAMWPNGGDGVEIAEADHNYVGGGGLKGNAISGNAKNGVSIHGPHAVGNQVVDSSIGLDVTGHRVVENSENGIFVWDGAAETQIKNCTISGNAFRGVEVSGVGTDGVLVWGCTIGLDAAEDDFLPNGLALLKPNAVGVLYHSGPGRVQVRNNRIHGRGAGVYCAGLSFTGPLAQLNEENVIERNRIGYNVTGEVGNGGFGAVIEGSHAYFGENDVRGCQGGLALNYPRPEADPDCYVGVRGCKFRDNDAHILFYDSARGHLGEYGASVPWKRGENWFGASRRAAVNSCRAKAGFTVKAENNDWGTTVAAQIRGRLECPANVDFDPIAGGVAPTGSGASAVAAVTALAVQPTAAGAAIQFTLAAEAAVTVSVANVAGRPVRALLEARPTGAGLQSVLWDGRADAGTRVPAGLYLVRVTAHGAQGGRSESVATVRLTR